VLTHGKAQTIGPALARLETVARDAGVELVVAADDGVEEADLAVVLGGDGTMLRALGRFLGTGIPVIGANFGRVGFLSSIPRAELEAGLARVFAGDYTVVELPTLDVQVGDEQRTAVNDLVVTSGIVGRMIQLEWALGDEKQGRLGCDGVVCSTPPGSTGYNFSNGGPVLVWGLDAMAVTFVAPHSLHARPLVVSKGLDLTVTNRSAEHAVTVLVDGHAVGDLRRDESLSVGLGDQTTCLALLPEVTFFSRYREVFP
jgi:NAD+ kinase